MLGEPHMNSRAHTSIGRDRASVAGKQPPVDESTDLLIIGAGPAGISAALTAAGGGVRVTLVDEDPVPLRTMGEDVPLHFGGRMAPTVANRNAVLESVLGARPRLVEAIDAGIDVRLGTAAWVFSPSDAQLAGSTAMWQGLRMKIAYTYCASGR